MPPAVSDESDIDVPDAIPARKGNGKSKTNEEPVDEPADDEEEDEEEAEDEYQVEKVVNHKWVRGRLQYQVKWLGYEDDADLTWEPDDNMDNAKEAVERYHLQIGGTPEPPNKGSAKSKAATKRAANATESPVPKKRNRKSETTNGTTNKSDEWEPPLGSWETSITRISAIIEEEELGVPIIKKPNTDTNNLQGLIEWNDGRKTQHRMALLRQKCPQRLLDYYESHLVFKGDPRYVGE